MKLNQTFEPPARLSERAQRLWCELVPARARSPERLALLETALRTLDRAEAAAAVVEKQGMVVKTKRTGALHVHPLLKVEKDQRQLFLRCWQELSFSWRSELDGSEGL